MSRATRLIVALTTALGLFVWCTWWPFAPEVLQWQLNWFTLVDGTLATAVAVSILRITRPDCYEGR